MFGIIGNLRLTFAIAAMTIGSLCVATLAVLGGLFFSLSASVQQDVEAEVTSSMRVAAQILQVNLPSLKVEIDEAGVVTALEARSMPRFRSHDVIDAVAAAAGEGVTIYVYDPETSPDMLVGSTSLMDAAGERLLDQPIPEGTPLFAGLTENQLVEQPEEINGESHLRRYQPIATADGTVIGALSVAVRRASFEAVVGQSMMVLAATSLFALLLTAIGSVLLSRRLMRPIPELAAVMDAIAEGKFDTEVPYTARRNEIGAMARAVEVFRANGAAKAILDIEARQHLAQAADHTGQLEAIARSQIVVEFNLDGTVISANPNFLNLVGYGLGEIVGQPNALFLFDADPASQSYRAFWEELAAGQFKSGEYRRRTKDGGEVWIQSTFTPIFDIEGVAYKVVQFATEVTARRQSVAAIGEGLERLARGDLTHRIETPFPPEFEDLRLALNGTVERFADVISQLRESVRALRLASGELLTGANDLSERTTRQAATIEQTSAAMEELASTVASNAGMAEEAARKAEMVSRAAEDSGAVMVDATDAMERITQSSARISNIIGLIDDIAFQTNLLALNASVEAARAGEAGKGFAVVAVEVRRLAQSAAQASSEVKALVDHSGQEVRSGADLVEAASGKLKAMLGALEDNNELVRAIARASREQAASIEEVNTAVRTLDQMTQHNASLVEETNQVFGQTESQTQALDEIVDIFQVDEQSKVVTTSRRAA